MTERDTHRKIEQIEEICKQLHKTVRSDVASEKIIKLELELKEERKRTDEVQRELEAAKKRFAQTAEKAAKYDELERALTEIHKVLAENFKDK